jgi:hypothetical protein
VEETKNNPTDGNENLQEVPSSKGFRFFGLNPTDPQDIVTAILCSVIAVNGIDLLLYFGRKIAGL